MKDLKNLKISIFADGANVEEMKKAYNLGIVKGFTTNPTLMRKAGVVDYKQFAKEVLKEIVDLPISFEVFSDEFDLMEKEAREIFSWGENVNIKIPITNTKGKSSIPLIEKLSKEGIPLNVTAILTKKQIRGLAKTISKDSKVIISIFAGRIADTGTDPIPYMEEAVELFRGHKNVEILWASPRELLNIFQAEECGCHIITVINDILKKNPMVGKDLEELSLETVKMFYNDANNAGYKII